MNDRLKYPTHATALWATCLVHTPEPERFELRAKNLWVPLERLAECNRGNEEREAFFREFFTIAEEDTSLGAIPPQPVRMYAETPAGTLCVYDRVCGLVFADHDPRMPPLVGWN